MNDINRMIQLWNRDGLSMGEIASSLGITRGKVSGIISRNRKLFEKRKDENWFKPLDMRKTKPRKEEQQYQTTEQSVVPFWEILSPEEYDQCRRPFSKDILEISDSECKWCVSDGPLMFCAEEVFGGKSYCRHHYNRSVGCGTRSEQNAVHDLKRIGRAA